MITYVPDTTITGPTFVELLRFRARHQPDQSAYIFLKDDATQVSITYRELDRQVRAIAGMLQRSKATGTTALLLLPPGLEYIAAFLGCFYAGVIAVPAYPPRLNKTITRLQAITLDSQAKFAITDSQLLSSIQHRIDEAPEMKKLNWVVVDSLMSNKEDSWQERSAAGDDLAFLQYTSGSTARPKGVMVSHTNLLYNSSMIHYYCGHSTDSLLVSWLPPYHDMGLVIGILQPLYGGFPGVLMSPFTFAQHPVRWLDAISTYKATTTCAPNFAYDFCVDKVTIEQQMALDLSSLEVAINAAEPVRYDTLDRFTTTFAPCGFRYEAFNPCYGLAEITVGASSTRKGEAPKISTLQKTGLEQNRVIEVSSSDKDKQKLVGCGGFIAQKVAIVHPELQTRCSPDEIGEIWLSSPSVTLGYWNRPQETERTFHAYLADSGEGPFLRTGDLGFLKEDEIFITGRLKDMIIIRGRNHYPQDIEYTVSHSHSALRSDCCAAFTIDVAQQEALVVVQEVARQYRQPDIEAIADTVRKAVINEHEVHIYAVVLIKHGSILRTSSNKIRRQACQEAFRTNALAVVGQSISYDMSLLDDDDLTLEKLLSTPSQKREALLENYLRDQAARLLKVAPKEIDAHISLSLLGFDSLSGIELAGDIEDKFGVILPTGYFPLGPSIATVASEVCKQLAEALPKETALVAAENPPTEYTLSYGQKAMWFLHQLTPQSAAYNITFAAQIPLDVDITALRHAFQLLVDRHPALRTTFSETAGEPIQRIHAHVELLFQVVDASAWDETTFNTQVLAEIHLPFDLEHGPLFRVSLYRRPEQNPVLLLVQHHSVSDFWSLGILLSELDTLYVALHAGQSISLPPIALHYTDYIRWQNDMLSGPEGEQLWNYWRNQLAGAPTTLAFPTDKPRPSMQTYNGSAYAFRLDKNVTQQLKTLVKTEGTTLYMELLAAFMVLLYRHTGQQDLLVGSPTTGRNRSKLADVMGYFVNPIVLRARFSHTLTFKTFLEQVRQTVLGALDHQEYPFPLLIEQLERERDVSRSPLFQVMFVYQKDTFHNKEGLAAFTEAVPVAGVSVDVGGMQFESIALQQHISRFDMMLVVTEVGEELGANLEYNSNLFDAATMERFAAHFQVVVQSLVSNLEQQIATFPFLLSDERDTLLTSWSGLRRPYPETSIHEVFEEQVRVAPSNTALRFQGAQMTYAELNERANQLAHYLLGQGFGLETPLGICMERSFEMVVAILGILKAGAVYVPLDPSYPQERLTFLLQDAQVQFLLTQERLKKGFSFGNIPMLCLDTEWSHTQSQPTHNLPSRVSPEHLAYIMYTSGSSGTPKGVCIPHRAVLRLVKENTFTHLDAQEVFLQLAPISFDASTFELWGSLLNGAQLVLFPPQLPSLNIVSETIQQEHISTLWLTAGLFHQMVDEHLSVLRTVPQLLAGGDILSVSHVRSVLENGYRSCLINGYGPTENTTFTCCYRMNSPEQVSSTHSVPIGHAIANTTVYVLDTWLQPVPLGAIGELCTGGDGLARNYLHAPDLTAEKFVPDPFSTVAGTLLYRTGDLVRFLGDGALEFVGRLDQQIKIRGYRVEPGEIESVLLLHPEIQESIVLPYENAVRQKSLVAYIVSKQEHSLQASTIRSYLQTRLPDYMLPSAFVFLEEFPLTVNSKIDRRALPKPEVSQQIEEEYAQSLNSPRTTIEEQLTSLWAEVLQLEQIDIHENFFVLGGHSLLAVQLFSRIRTTFQIELPIESLFEAPTVVELALSIEQAQKEQGTISHASIVRLQRDDIQDTLTQIDALSDEEIEELLRLQLTSPSTTETMDS